MIRIGAADKTVHPYYTRRMFRLLRQQRTIMSPTQSYLIRNTGGGIHTRLMMEMLLMTLS